jgi:hypothetical protein
MNENIGIRENSGKTPLCPHREVEIHTLKARKLTLPPSSCDLGQGA